MKLRHLFILSALISGPSYADLASTTYVDEAINNRVAKSAGTTNTMAGSYTISGTMTVDSTTGSLEVPTQPLPTVTE